MTKRNPPAGGAGEARAAVTYGDMTCTPYVPPVAIAPPLIRFDDVDGAAVFFDPRHVTGVRDARSNKIVSTIVTVSPPNAQGTSQVYIVVGRAENVGDRINMHRRGHGEKMEQAVADMKLRGIFEETDYDITSGKLVVPDEIPVTGINYFVQEDASNAAAAREGTAD